MPPDGSQLRHAGERVSMSIVLKLHRRICNTVKITNGLLCTHSMNCVALTLQLKRLIMGDESAAVNGGIKLH